eukprot:jgi/Bigna1/142064/aug1.67_g16772
MLNYCTFQRIKSNVFQALVVRGSNMPSSVIRAKLKHHFNLERPKLEVIAETESSEKPVNIVNLTTEETMSIQEEKQCSKDSNQDGGEKKGSDNDMKDHNHDEPKALSGPLSALPASIAAIISRNRVPKKMEVDIQASKQSEIQEEVKTQLRALRFRKVEEIINPNNFPEESFITPARSWAEARWNSLRTYEVNQVSETGASSNSPVIPESDSVNKTPELNQQSESEIETVKIHKKTKRKVIPKSDLYDGPRFMKLCNVAFPTIVGVRPRAIPKLMAISSTCIARPRNKRERAKRQIHGHKRVVTRKIRPPTQVKILDISIKKGKQTAKRKQLCKKKHNITTINVGKKLIKDKRRRPMILKDLNPNTMRAVKESKPVFKKRQGYRLRKLSRNCIKTKDNSVSSKLRRPTRL